MHAEDNVMESAPTSTFMCVPRIELGPPGLHSKHWLSHIAGQ